MIGEMSPTFYSKQWMRDMITVFIYSPPRDCKEESTW